MTEGRGRQRPQPLGIFAPFVRNEHEKQVWRPRNCQTPFPYFSPVTCHFLLVSRARVRHNTPQRDTPDEAVTNELEPYVGRTDVVRPQCAEAKMSGIGEELVEVKETRQEDSPMGDCPWGWRTHNCEME